jgi:uncharacterized membrane protein
VNARPEILAAILMVGLASYLCRAGGFFLMRYVRVTPRVEAGLQAIPMAIVGAILGPVAANGGPAEWVGLAAAAGLMRATGSDFISIVGAVAAVAVTRRLL